MNGEGQSQQAHEAPTAPGPGGSERPHEAPMTPDTGDTGNEADHQSSGTSVTSPRQRRGRFHLRKPKIGLLAIVITAIVGFFFGIASNQVTGFVNRADDCDAALSRYVVGIEADSHLAYREIRTPDRTDQQREDALAKFFSGISAPYDIAVSKCSLDGPDEYLNKDEAQAFMSHYKDLLTCTFYGSADDQYPCSLEKWQRIHDEALDSTSALSSQASNVSQWGLVRRGRYAVTHLW
jgi:hypothetical protein